MKRIAISFTSFLNSFWEKEVKLKEIDVVKFGCHSLNLFPNSFGNPLPLHDSLDDLDSNDTELVAEKLEYVPVSLAYIHNNCCDRPSSKLPGKLSALRHKHNSKLANREAKHCETNGNSVLRTDIDENILAMYDQFLDWLVSDAVKVWFRNTGNYDGTATSYSRQLETYRRRGFKVFYHGWHDPVIKQTKFSFA